MQGFELEILNWIQAHLRCGILDAVMPAVSWICNHGEVWILLAAVIAFSRLYLYAHWPTDILGGILVGTLAGWLGAKLVQLLAKKGEKN